MNQPPIPARHDENRRSSNRWTALVLALIAMLFFGGVIVNHWYFR